jgi:hypothetical protein
MLEIEAEIGGWLNRAHLHAMDLFPVRSAVLGRAMVRLARTRSLIGAVATKGGADDQR